MVHKHNDSHIRLILFSHRITTIDIQRTLIYIDHKLYHQKPPLKDTTTMIKLWHKQKHNKLIYDKKMNLKNLKHNQNAIHI